MLRHFLQLYLSIVLTLAAVGWAQERLWLAYGRQSAAQMTTEHRSQAAALSLIEHQLLQTPKEDRQRRLASLVAPFDLDVELFEAGDIAGADAFERLALGEPAFMTAGEGETWMLRRLADDGRILAFRYSAEEAPRSALEWGFALMFYAAIALVVMMWLWPLTRDLKRLERATHRFGDRGWSFDAMFSPRSQIASLADAFRRMAARIDALIASHKDMSNAVAHEIKTPLARMRFEIEMARTAQEPRQVAERLSNIDRDVMELNAFVTAMLDYAILERAEVALNIAAHDFTAIVPAVAESVRRAAPQGVRVDCDVDPAATHVRCDAHLIETVLRNYLYNALRFAARQVCVTFRLQDGRCRLEVDDDGPGVPDADRERVFASFVQLPERGREKTGFGLGLAIVKRIIEWHGGAVGVATSRLGGAQFWAEWGGQAGARGQGRSE